VKLENKKTSARRTFNNGGLKFPFPRARG